jgi:hypothetical protein
MAFTHHVENSSLKPLLWISENGDDDALINALNQVVEQGAKSLMILACSANNHSATYISAALKSCTVPICGGIFPSVFSANKKLDKGFIVVGFPIPTSVASYSLIDSALDANVPDSLDGNEIEQSQDLLIFVDSMANATELFISRLFESIGGGIDVIGGGAGSVDFIQRPCVFSRAGLVMNTALVVQLPVSMHCAVEHGWEILSGPFLVTESKGTRVKTINYQSAFDIYKALVEDITSYRFAGNNFFEVAKNFPLGIVGINNDILVRDPLQSLNSELYCVGSVPVNSMIYILEGNAEHLIAAAEKAGRLAAKQSSNNSADDVGLTVVFDCVSRVLYLGDSFPLELAAIQKGVGGNRAIIGALSIGEIANTSRGTINLLNKSIVIGNL